MLKHGGRLREAAEHYHIPLAHWIDLSTGINPNGYPIPDIPAALWQRLPEDQDDLIATAQCYYQCDALLAIAGSQAAIQSLPLLRPQGKVGFIQPSYAEHAYAWKKAGHHIINLEPETINQHIQQLNVLVLINPNNPSAQTFTHEQCLSWLTELNKHNGWLIIDEAFIDATPELSLSYLAPLKGLIILRSIGKFFGLAGIRSGFVLAEQTILNKLAEHLGPWAVSNPSRFITQHALQNSLWQQTTRKNLNIQSQRLRQLLQQYQLPITGSNALFQWVKTPQAAHLHQQLAQHAILTRLFTQPSSIRFGLPANELAWGQLETALQTLDLGRKGSQIR